MKMMEPEEVPLKEDKYIPMSPMEMYKKSYGDLFKAPRDLWLLFIIKFCLYGSFSTFLSALAIYITEVEGYSDGTLSLAFGLIGGSGLVFIILFGSFNDRYGIRFTLIIGSFAASIPFIVISFNRNIYINIIVMMIPGSFSIALLGSALETGIKYYTHIHYRTLALSFYSAISYISLIGGGLLLQILMYIGDKDYSTFRIIFLYCAINCMIALVLSYFLRQLDYSTFEEVEVSTKKAFNKSNWTFIRETIVTKKFWRFAAVIFILLLIKIIFFQQSIVLPIYMYRDMGDDSNYGFMIVLNQVIIIITLPLFSYLIYFYAAYDIFIIGGSIAVISVLPFIYGANYYTIVSYIVLSSLAESLYSPRLVEYAFEVSPKGKEGIMIALVGLITILGTILSGIVGGILLGDFCPEDGQRHCWLMWLIIGVIPLPGLLVLFLARKYLEEPLFEAQPFVSFASEAKHY
ncbi:hypothetical protein SteCoe_1264 [Stentor coeruleus]|uniref:Major facilitator superfamily (MFS) profile domain-containing protein n=1 Tax=Stentor coeruleus TaxID=5963 RepID=A0A1R2D253_9CILI|nr:hypothetical protein SteCoe_1264 [Stentor coeruleus]